MTTEDVEKKLKEEIIERKTTVKERRIRRSTLYKGKERKIVNGLRNYEEE